MATANVPVEAPKSLPKKPFVTPKQLPPPNSDFYELAETLPPDELAVVKQVRAFMENKVAPIITKYWVDDAFPFELLPDIKELNIGGVAMNGYGCRGGSALLFGLVAIGNGALRRIDCNVLWCPQWLGDGIHLSWRIRGTKTEEASANGALGKNRLLRPDRAPGGFGNLRRHDDDGKARRRYLGLEWPEKVNRQLSVVRHLGHLGTRPRRQPGQGFHRGEQDDA